MAENAGNRVSISRVEFLESFDLLFSAIKDYEGLINVLSNDDDLDPLEVKQIVRERVTKLEFCGVNTKAMEMIGAYIRYTISKFKGEKLTFFIPDNLDDSYFTPNKGYLELSKSIQVVEDELKEIEEKIYYLSRLLPPFNINKTQLLLKTVSSFFKSIIRKDVDDMSSHINHMHHLTASKESYFVINDIGYMVRDIHNSLQDLTANVPLEKLDPTLIGDMPDAIDKLNLVIKRMEESANSTLDNAESLLEKSNQCVTINSDMLAQCSIFNEKLKRIQEKYPDASEEIEDVIIGMKENLEAKLIERSRQLKEEETLYFDIISNQSFQDLTGQTLKKIIAFIEQLEINLLNILQKYGGKMNPLDSESLSKKAVSPLLGKETKEGLILEGPKDNRNTEERLANQSDVNKMLAEFGF